jgi:hypothetical protein
MNVLSILQNGANRQMLEMVAGVSMLFLARFRLGRIFLHLVAMLGDRCVRFRGSGIMRELSWLAALAARFDRDRTRTMGTFLLASRIRSGSR